MRLGDKRLKAVIEVMSIEALFNNTLLQVRLRWDRRASGLGVCPQFEELGSHASIESTVDRVPNIFGSVNFVSARGVEAVVLANNMEQTSGVLLSTEEKFD